MSHVHKIGLLVSWVKLYVGYEYKRLRAFALDLILFFVKFVYVKSVDFGTNCKTLCCTAKCFTNLLIKILTFIGFHDVVHSTLVFCAIISSTHH